MLSNKQLAGVLPLADRPRALFLKPGNLCNLACRHCDPQVSSRWYPDYYKVEVQPHGKQTYHEWLRQFDTTRDSYRDENPNWAILKSWVPDTVFYDLYGAEPLLIAPMYEVIKQSADTGASVDQEIHINTNGTIWRDEYVDVFSKYKLVRLELSVDGIGAQFEYMRYPAKWDQMLANLQKYRDMSLVHTKIKVGITVTLSLYNILDAADIKNWFAKELNITNVGFNFVHLPVYMDMRNAPDSAKEVITARLASAGNLRGVIDFLNSPIDNREENIKQFFYYTDKYDELRNEKYSDVFPEMYQLLKDYK
jgi:sulfatase maturation enzyme AslB (radical SAM superfamily)